MIVARPNSLAPKRWHRRRTLAGAARAFSRVFIGFSCAGTPSTSPLSSPAPSSENEPSTMEFISFGNTTMLGKLDLGEVKGTTVSLQLADRSIKYPRGIEEDVLVKVDKLIFSADFIVLEMEEDVDAPIILGHPFLTIGRTLIDVQQGKLILRVQDDRVTFNVFHPIKYLNELDEVLQFDSTVQVVKEVFKETESSDQVDLAIVQPKEGGTKYIVWFELKEKEVRYIKFLEYKPPLPGGRIPIYLDKPL